MTMTMLRALFVALLALLFGCSSADFVVAPLEADVAPLEADVAPLEADVAPLEADVAECDCWPIPVGACEYNATTNACTVHPGWWVGPPACNTSGFVVKSCAGNPDGAGDGSPCLPELVARKRGC